MKTLLERGIKDAMEAVDAAVDRDPNVKAADVEIYAVLASLEIVLGPELYNKLEEAISTARAADIDAAFRFGVTEGLRLANAVRSLIGAGGGV